MKSLSLVLLFATPWTVAYQAPQSMEFSRQELPFPSPGNLPNPGIEPGSPELQADTLLSEPPQGGVCNSSKVNDKHCKMCVFLSSAPLGHRTRELRLFFLVSDSLGTTGSDQSLKREEQERGRQGR